QDHPPLVLEGLDAGVYYEIFVAALNAHGKGGPSPRLVFRTKYQENVDPLPIQSYNMTKCCHASGLLPQCMPLCTLDIKMSDIHELGATCQAQMGTGNIPGPVEDVHVTSVTNNSISLAWVPPDVSGNNSSSANIADNYTDFVIQYGKVNNMTMYETVVKLEHI
uniref:Fibronectin type-III domain-containing protein n=1 Tax=Megaselia scalaris TaxID=36166 RepID=T1GWU7_MEGSC